MNRINLISQMEKKQGPKVLNVEMRVFIDTQAHANFKSYFGDDAKETNFYIATMNAVRNYNICRNFCTLKK